MDAAGDVELRALCSEPEAYDVWAKEWRQRLRVEGASPEERAAGMRLVNPAIIPRNHRVAQAIEAAERGDFSVFERLRRVLRFPFEEPQDFREMTLPPEPQERVLRTFCGT